MIKQLRNLFKGKPKKQEKDFSEMSKKEKKEFLSMDLVDRMIRVEQRVASSFNEHVPYNKTEYYKNLKEHEKEKFNKYLKRKTRKRTFITLLLLLIFISPIFLKMKLTGFVITNDLQTSFSLLEAGWLLFGLVFICILSISFVLNKFKKRKFEKYFNIIDEIALKNYVK